MEAKNYKVIRSFLKDDEKECVLAFIKTLSRPVDSENIHIKDIAEKLNGRSNVFDLSRTKISKAVAEYQAGVDLEYLELPQVFHDILYRITSELHIPCDNAYLQIIDMNSGGKISPHYDATYPGHINLKCNISVVSEDYAINIGDEELQVKEGDLYSFEASLFKHWTPNPFANHRTLLSYGLVLKYDVLGRDENDPRVRMSNRIMKRFQV